MKYRTFGIIDLVIIGALLLVSVAFIPLMKSYAPSTVAVYRDNRVIARYPLEADKRFTVHGEIGDVSVHIHNSRVSVEKSTCSKQICVTATPVSNVGQQIVCAPNHILVQIESSSEDKGPDAIAR
ncbi:MAG: hypothetical protein GF401_20855 [Chitinivibrionales bacterium]|nr:hypothetical protein [Chitinivibrionales bacterium]